MDIDNLQQNMNTRVVFKEPRGMIRWLQLFFAIIAFSTVVDFYTTIGIDITCPNATITTTTTTTTTTTKAPAPQPVTSAPLQNLPTTVSSTTSSKTPQTANAAPVSSLAPASNSVQSTSPTTAPVALAQQAGLLIHPKFIIKYPFNFDDQSVNNTCQKYSYQHPASLSGSPQFFVMTGVLAMLWATMSLTVYLFYSSTYESVPIWPVVDLIVTGIICLFWFIGSAAFSSGVTILKSTATYDNLYHQLCPAQFLEQPGTSCVPSPTDVVSWKSLNVGLVSGYTSFFLWAAGMWFVYKETHFHTPRDQFGPR